MLTLRSRTGPELIPVSLMSCICLCRPQTMLTARNALEVEEDNDCSSQHVQGMSSPCSMTSAFPLFTKQLCGYLWSGSITTHHAGCAVVSCWGESTAHSTSKPQERDWNSMPKDIRSNPALRLKPGSEQHLHGRCACECHDGSQTHSRDKSMQI